MKQIVKYKYAIALATLISTGAFAECKNYVFHAKFLNPTTGETLDFYPLSFVGKLKYCDANDGSKIGAVLLTGDKGRSAVEDEEVLMSSVQNDKTGQLTINGSAALYDVSISTGHAWNKATLTFKTKGTDGTIQFGGDLLIEGSKEGAALTDKIQKEFKDHDLFDRAVVADNDMLSY